MSQLWRCFTFASLLLLFLFLLPFKVSAEDLLTSYKITDEIANIHVNSGETFFETQFNYDYETGGVYLGSDHIAVNNTEVGQAIEIVVIRPDGYSTRYSHSYDATSYCQVTAPLEPVDLTSYMGIGSNVVYVRLISLCGGSAYSSPLYLVNDKTESALFDTGYVSPTSFIDDDGYWYSEENAYVNDDTYASNGVHNKRGRWLSYDFNIPNGAVIVGIEVRGDMSSGTGWYEFTVSNGLTFSDEEAPKITAIIGSIDYPIPLQKYSYIIGGRKDLWSLSWDSENINNLQVRVRTVRGTKHWLYWLPVKVYYTVPDQVTVLDVPSFKQIDVNWSGEVYDSATKQPMWCGDSIGECGCAMTSAAMAMVYNGLSLTPDGLTLTPSTLNEYLSRDPKLIVRERLDGTKFNTYKTNGYSWGDFAFDWVDDFSLLTHNVYVDQPKLEQAVVENYNLEQVKQYIDNGVPVILKVKNSVGSYHWVVAKGYLDDEVIINDPYYLDPTNDQYETLSSKGYTIPGEGKMVTYTVTHSDFSSFVLKVPSPAQLLVTDEEGRRTGYLDANTTVEEIPKSTYYLSEFVMPPDATSGPPVGAGINHLYIRVPQPGRYKVELILPDGNPAIYTIYASTTEGENETYDFSEDIEIVYTDEGDNPAVLQADIDVRPFVKKNIIVPWSFGMVPVGIFSKESLPTKDIRVNSLRFGKTGNENSLALCIDIDLNKDKVKDKYCLFRENKTNLQQGDAKAYLSGETKYGLNFTASDDVVVSRFGFW